jgi:hypothetical protein
MSARHLQREAQAAAALKAALADVLDPDDDRELRDFLEGETGLLEAIDASMRQISDDQALAEATSRQIEQLEARHDWCVRRVQRMRDALRSVLEQFPSSRNATRPTAPKGSPASIARAAAVISGSI